MLLLSLLISKILKCIKKIPTIPIKKIPTLPTPTTTSIIESNTNKLFSKAILLLSPLLPPIIISKRCSQPLGSKNRFKLFSIVKLLPQVTSKAILVLRKKSTTSKLRPRTQTRSSIQDNNSNYIILGKLEPTKPIGIFIDLLEEEQV